MKNKVLVEIFIPSIDYEFDVFLPINKNIANAIELICKSVEELKQIDKIDFDNLALYNRDTGFKYIPYSLIKTTDIRNGYRLLLM